MYFSDKKQVAELLLNAGCYVKAEGADSSIKLPNGDAVPIYLSCRLLFAQPSVRLKIENMLAEMVRKDFPNIEVIVGMATAGIPWACAIANRLELPMLYIRSSKKQYGLGGLIEGGAHIAPKQALIIDDVLLTGATVASARKELEDNNFVVAGVACIALLSNVVTVLRGQHEINISLLTDYREILSIAANIGMLSDHEIRLMSSHYKSQKVML